MRKTVTPETNTIKQPIELKLYRDMNGWYFKLWIFSIYLDKSYKNYINSFLDKLLKKQIGGSTSIHAGLRITLLFSTEQVIETWNPNKEYCRITESEIYTKHIPNLLTYRFMNMNKSEKHVHFYETKDLKNEIYFGSFLMKYFQRKYASKLPVYIKI